MKKRYLLNLFIAAAATSTLFSVNAQYYQPSYDMGYVPSSGYDYVPSAGYGYVPSSGYDYVPSAGYGYVPPTGYGYNPYNNMGYPSMPTGGYPMPSVSLDSFPTLPNNDQLIDPQLAQQTEDFGQLIGSDNGRFNSSSGYSIYTSIHDGDYVFHNPDTGQVVQTSDPFYDPNSDINMSGTWNPMTSD